MHSWEEVKNAANILGNALFGFNVEDPVKDIYNGVISQFLIHILAEYTASENQPTHLQAELDVCIEGYRQLQKKGYIGEQSE